jgi:hypothetical protein
MAQWIFQGNPKYYRVTDALQALPEIDWLVTRYREAIQPGDDALIWVAGKRAGIYARGVVTEAARQVRERTEGSAYWLQDPVSRDDVPRCRIRIVRTFLEAPLLRAELRRDAVLKDLLVIRAPNATNFPVTDAQWERLEELLA